MGLWGHSPRVAVGLGLVSDLTELEASGGQGWAEEPPLPHTTTVPLPHATTSRPASPCHGEMLAVTLQEDLLGSEGVRSQRSLTWSPSADARTPVLALCVVAEEGPAHISPQASKEVANRSHQSSHVCSKTALEETLKSPAQTPESCTGTENKQVNGVEEEISDRSPKTAAAEGQASRSSSQAWRQKPQRDSQRAWGQEHQPSGQHLMGPEPAGNAREAGMEETRESEGSRSKMGDTVQRAGSSASVS